MEQNPQPAPLTPIEPPNGMYPARLDEKGRLKLPAGFLHFFNSIGERTLFVTSLDRRIARIYPMSVWRTNKNLFETYPDDSEDVGDVAFNAADLGADAEIDNQGRVLFNSELRRQLDLEGQELHLWAYKGHVQVLNEALYQERKGSAQRDPKLSVAKLERKGLR